MSTLRLWGPETARGRAALALAAVALALALASAALLVERYEDAPLLLLIVPLALGAVSYGLRGGVGMGAFASALAAVWWLEQGSPGGAGWLSARVLAYLVVGAVLGWVIDSRNALVRAAAHHYELSLDLIATASFEGFFTNVNPAFTRTLGFSAEELLAHPFLDFVHPEDREPTLAALAEQTEQGREVLDFQNRYRTKSGGYRWLEWRSRPDPDGRTLIAVARDVTERKELEQLTSEYRERLEQAVRERTKELTRRSAELEEARGEMLRRLALAAEYRDDETYEHTERIGRAAARLAEALGLPADEVGVLREAAPLHDIGKLAVSDTVLLKPGKLAPDELEHMRRHAAAGAKILAGSSSQVLRAAEEIALCHHEWWDGSGYPAGLRGEEIPLRARIVALADVFDALTHRRPYKPAWPVEDAVAEIRRLAGVQFDPRLVDAFEALDPYELAGLDTPRSTASQTGRSAA